MLSLIRSKHLREITDTNQRLTADLTDQRSNVMPRLQRLEHELASARLDRFLAEVNLAIRLTVCLGLEAGTIEKGMRGLAAPLPRGSPEARACSHRVATFGRNLYARERPRSRYRRN